MGRFDKIKNALRSGAAQLEKHIDDIHAEEAADFLKMNPSLAADAEMHGMAKINADPALKGQFARENAEQAFNYGNKDFIDRAHLPNGSDSERALKQSQLGETFGSLDEPNFQFGAPKNSPVSPDKAMVLRDMAGTPQAPKMSPEAPNFNMVDGPSGNFPAIRGSGIPEVPSRGGVPQSLARNADDAIEREVKDVGPRSRSGQANSAVTDDVIISRGKQSNPLMLPGKQKKTLKDYLFPAGATAAGAGYLYSLLNGDEPKNLVEVPGEPGQIKASPEEKPVDPAKAPGAGSVKAKSKSVGPSGQFPMGVGALQNVDAKTVDFGNDGAKDSAKALADVQKRQSDAIMMNQLGKSANQIGAAIAGVKPVGQELYDDNIKQASTMTEEHAARMEKEKDDPNSPLSQGLRAQLMKMGYKVKGNPSATDLQKVIPGIEKLFTSDETRKLHSADMAQKDRHHSQDMMQKQNQFNATLKLNQDKLSAKGGVSKGQEMMDKEGAKLLADWNLKGARGGVYSDIEKLKEVEKLLGPKGDNVSGFLVGNIPGQALFNADGKQIKDMVASVLQKDLKNTLGGQFAQKEGEDFIKRGYDETMDEKWNLKRVRRLRKMMEKHAEAKDNAGQYFDENGTFKGYQPDYGTTDPEDMEDTPKAPTTMSAMTQPDPQDDIMVERYNNMSDGDPSKMTLGNILRQKGLVK